VNAAPIVERLKTPLGRVAHLVTSDAMTLCGKDSAAAAMTEATADLPDCRACVSQRDYGTKHEAPAIGAMASRVMRSLVRRAQEGDPEALEVLLGLQGVLQEAVTEAGRGLHDRGHSYAWIADVTGTSRQAAAKRFGPKAGPKPTGEPEGTASLLDALAEAGVA